jgi:transposase
MLVAERQRAKRASLPRVKRSLARLIAAREKELTEIDQDIDTEVRGSPAWREAEDLLASVPGVGSVTARTLLAECPELGRLDRRQVAALAAWRPSPGSAGKWKGKARIGGDRAVVRTALTIATMAAIRHNPVIKAFRDCLVAAGKPKMVALIAAARKLLTILNAILRDKTPWQTA